MSPGLWTRSTDRKQIGNKGFVPSIEFLEPITDSCDRAVLISQNADEIYLTVAHFSASYLAYIDGNGAPLRKEDFMVLSPYGPWPLDDADAIDELSKLLVAFVLSCRG